MANGFQNNAIFWVEVDKIKPNPYQPRKDFDEAALQSLADSIKQYGVLQPLVVTRKEESTPDGGLRVFYELVAGERRLRASKLAGLTQVPVLIRDKEDSDQEKLELAIIENLQREDLNPIDKALAFKQLHDKFNMTHAQIAQKVGKSREYVSNALRLLALPEDIQRAIANGIISEGHARPLLMLSDKPEEQQTLFKEITMQKLTVREAEHIARSVATEKVRKNHIPPKLRKIERELTENLGTRVRIEQKDGQVGRIHIDFTSEDDLMHLLELVKAHSSHALAKRPKRLEEPKEGDIKKDEGDSQFPNSTTALAAALGSQEATPESTMEPLETSDNKEKEDNALENESDTYKNLHDLQQNYEITEKKEEYQQSDNSNETDTTPQSHSNTANTTDVEAQSPEHDKQPEMSTIEYADFSIQEMQDMNSNPIPDLNSTSVDSPELNTYSNNEPVSEKTDRDFINENINSQENIQYNNQNPEENSTSQSYDSLLEDSQNFQVWKNDTAKTEYDSINVSGFENNAQISKEVTDKNTVNIHNQGEITSETGSTFNTDNVVDRSDNLNAFEKKIESILEESEKEEQSASKSIQYPRGKNSEVVLNPDLQNLEKQMQADIGAIMQDPSATPKSASAVQIQDNTANEEIYTDSQLHGDSQITEKIEQIMQGEPNDENTEDLGVVFNEYKEEQDTMPGFEGDSLSESQKRALAEMTQEKTSFDADAEDLDSLVKKADIPYLKKGEGDDSDLYSVRNF